MNHIVGIDVSLTGTGIACTCGKLARFGKDGITTMPLPDRVEAVDFLAGCITEWTHEHGDERYALRFPSMVVVELPAFSKSGGGTLERHALWWKVVSTLIGYGNGVATVPATTLKLYALGKGSGKGTLGKGPMVDALARRLPMFETGGNTDMVDAAWLAAMGADRLGAPLCDMPQANRAALTKVVWP